MTNSDPIIYLGDPLSQISRIERRNLLVASTIGLLVGHVGLVPNHISALGLDFNTPSQNAFLVLLSLVIIYMTVAFSIYSTADYFIWRKRYYDHLVNQHYEYSNWTEEDQDAYDDLRKSVAPIHWYWQKAPVVAWLRIIFEFALPIVVGLYTAGMLVMHVARS